MRLMGLRQERVFHCDRGLLELHERMVITTGEHMRSDLLTGCSM